MIVIYEIKCILANLRKNTNELKKKAFLKSVCCVTLMGRYSKGIEHVPH